MGIIDRALARPGMRGRMPPHRPPPTTIQHDRSGWSWLPRAVRLTSSRA
jgi:hypothetical protein